MKLKSLVGISLVLGATLSMTACSTDGVATPSGMCGWVVGDGKDGRDAKVKRTLYPDEKVEYEKDKQVVQFVPCGPRNYIINDGTVKKADGTSLGDRLTPIEATTKDGTPVLVHVSAFFQLNQQVEALPEFKEFCNKYECYTTEAKAGESNFASPEWNGMLAENMGPAIESSMGPAMKTMPDQIWKNKDPNLYKELATLLSADFAESIRVRTGYSEDLFCGSGNSGWDDPNKVGKDGTFTCSNVRFEVNKVVAANAETEKNATVESQEEADKKANQSRFNSSQPLYGDQTSRWLGLQDTVDKCPEGSTCNFYLGESASK